ncbi:MAG: YfhO family protein [Chloroflexi bacterium]|nr:YfhO family protein [Chloroflexota bacterium]
MKSLKDNSIYLPIIFFPLVLFSTAIFGGKALFWGTPTLQFVPWHSLAIEILKSGNLPLWNPFNGMGAPLAANYQSALFYPPNWLALLAGWVGGDGMLAWMHTLLISLHLIWMGFGMARLVGYLGYGRMSQLISGLAFSLSGYFVARAGFFSMIWAAAWLPWILYAASRISFPGQRTVWQNNNRFNVELAIFMGMQLLAGHAQLTWYTWILLFGWLTFGGWGINRWNGVLVSWKKAFLPGLLALGIAAVQLFITAEYLIFSQRSTTVDFETAMTYSLWPWRLLGFLLPDFFGNPGSGNYWGYASFWEDAVYIGVLPFILALFTLPKLWKKSTENGRDFSEQNLIRFLWFFALISVIMALGKNTPVFPFLFRFIPTFDMFNSPARYMIWAVFCLAFLAGIGYEYWKRPKEKKLYWVRLGTAGGFAVTLGAFLAWFALDEVSATFIRSTAFCGLFTLITGILTLTQPDSGSVKKTNLWQIVTILFIGCDLCISNWPSIPLIDTSFYEDATSVSAMPDLNSERIYLSPDDEYFIKFKRFLKFESYQIDENWDDLLSLLIPNSNIFQNVSSANNFDPLVPRRYRQMMDYVNELPYAERQPWFNLMGVTLLEKRSSNNNLGITFEEMQGSNRFRVFYCAEIVENDELAWQKLTEKMKLENGVYAADTVVIESDNTVSEACTSPTEYQINILADEPGYLKLELTSSKPGWFMVADSWYPGWSAENNSQKIEIFPGNYLFRAVRFYAGNNLIEMSYSPTIFRVGLGASIISILITISICLNHWKSRRSKRLI